LTSFDYRKLSELIVGNKDIDIEYCVGEIKREVDNEKSKKMYNGQMALFNNLKNQKIIIKKGFMMKIGELYHEKGVDVRMATDIVKGALKKQISNFLYNFLR